MAERGISEAEVEAVLANHHTDRPGNLPDRRVYIGRVGGRRIAVVVVESSDLLIIVTVRGSRE